MKVKIIENQLYEEKLKQQQKNDEEIQKVSVSCRAVSFHTVPLAMARVVFLSRKRIDGRFQSNATFLFSKIK
mgnify:CR=1 FL=1